MSRNRLPFGLMIAASVGILLGSDFLALLKSTAWSDERVDDSQIRESSGLAISQHAKNRFWTHNDSGGSAQLFALDRSPERSDAAPRVTAIPLAGAEAVDWEDIASGVVDGRATLVVADIGDNQRRRDRVTLYVIDEPLLDRASRDQASQNRGITVQPRHRIEVRYPDGARDCEAIAIDVEQRRVICISKEVLPLAGIYSVPLPPVDQPLDPVDSEDAVRGAGSATVVTAERLGTLPLPMVTGMDIRGDGRQMAVTGYFDLFLFDRDEGESWQVALRRVPKHIALPKLKQIEAVCFDHRGQLWVTSEGHPMPMLRVSPPSGDGISGGDVIGGGEKVGSEGTR